MIALWLNLSSGHLGCRSLSNLFLPPTIKKINRSAEVIILTNYTYLIMIEPIFDGELDVAVGKTRRSVKWKNERTTWGKLLNRIKETHRTPETYKEYIAANKDRQGVIKDIGGFVGGYLTSGRRKARNVLHRCIVTLDIDFGGTDFWTLFSLQYDCAAAVYSTHAHGPNKPRYRLLIPLDRCVQADEYLAISRRIAGNIGIDQFDPTTFQPERLMYWPSTAKDGLFEFEWQDGPWIEADNVLASYRNWKDSSEWPISAIEKETVQREAKQQGDPLEKAGIVGAFCRTYGIADVIERYLEDVYEPCDIEGRYTYIEGSTAAGLVVYDDKFAYSHHGTDPISGILCNAFDLVRLHRFGAEDEKLGEDVPIHKRLSYKAMCELAVADRKVRRLIGQERQQEALEDFKDGWTDDSEPGKENWNDDDCMDILGAAAELPEKLDDRDALAWLEDMEIDSKNNYLNTIGNVVRILDNDPILKKCFKYNAFTDRALIVGRVPWPRVGDSDSVTDADLSGLRAYLEKVYKGLSSRLVIQDGFDIHLASRAFNPVRDYLLGLVWDGQPRVDTLLIDYLGAENSEYVRQVTRKALVAGVARIMQPGIKYDYVLTIIGDQGIRKSTLVKRLGVNWFSDSFNMASVHSKEAYEQIKGVWIVEMAELAGSRKAEIESIKHFITKQEDSWRPAYGRNTVHVKRQCIYIATTNDRNFLRDITGNRRFWPVDCMQQAPILDIVEDLTPDEVGQIWAEAFMYYKKGERLYLTAEMEAEARLIQEDHEEKDERLGMIASFAELLLPDGWDEFTIPERQAWIKEKDEGLKAKGKHSRKKLCVGEVWCELFCMPPGTMTKNNTKEIHGLMRKLEDWKEHENKLNFIHYGVQRAYVRK